MDSELSRIVQVGTVTALDVAAHKVRVKFQHTGLTSDWLPVLKNAPSVSCNTAGSHDHSGSVSVQSADGHTHGASVSVDNSDGHKHSISVSAWMPAINDTVLVVYLPVFNSDGFVIGGI